MNTKIPRPSSINSMEIAINRRIQRYVNIVDSIIIKDSRRKTTLKILSDILKIKKLNIKLARYLEIIYYQHTINLV